MTTPLPRRLKDLVSFDADSDDEYSIITPCKPKNTKDAAQTAVGKSETM